MWINPPRKIVLNKYAVSSWLPGKNCSEQLFQETTEPFQKSNYMFTSPVGTSVFAAETDKHILAFVLFSVILSLV